MKFLLMAAIFFPSLAMAASEKTLIWPPGDEFGLITQSCQTYINSYSRLDNNSYATLPYDASITSYFSAINDVSETPNRHTGRTTNSEGIVGEVKLYCLTHPSDSISKATFAVYVKMFSEQK